MRITSFRKRACTFICTWLSVGSACSSSLDPSLDNRSCSADGQCVDGYVCSLARVCVHASRAEVDDRLAADGGTTRTGLALDSDAAAESSGDDSPRLRAVGVAGAASSTAGAEASSASGSGGSGAASGTGAASAGAAEPTSAGASAPTPVPGAANANTAGMPANAGAPSTPPAGHGSMPTPVACEPGLEQCIAMCVDLTRDPLHCGSCDKRCKADKSCVAGKCEKMKGGTPVPEKDVAALATLLELFGLDLSDLADLLGVDEDDLDSTKITLDDLKDLGIGEAALGLLGFGIDALALIGIDVSAG